MGVYILYGNEPYLLNSYKKFFERKVKNEINIGYFEKWTDEILPFLKTYPLFDKMRIGIVSIDALNQMELSEKEFNELKIFPDAELIVFVSKIDKRSKEYRFYNGKKAIKECNKISDAKRVEKILLDRIKTLGGRITRDALTLFLEKENYLGCEDVNLYNLFSDIDRLLAYNSDITTDMVTDMISEHTTEDIFGIAKMIKESDVKGLQRQCNVITNPIGTLSALLREYRIAYKEKYFSMKEIGVKRITLTGFSKDELICGMDIITEAIYGIKNGTLSEKNAFRYVISKLMMK